MKNWNNSEELAKSYQRDLKPLKAIYSYYRDRRDIYLKLVRECEEQGEWALSEEFNADYLEYRERAKEIGAIVSSSTYSINWLKQGHEPIAGKSCGTIHATKTIQVADVDQALIYLNQLKTEYSQMDEEQLHELEIFLQGMTEREKDVFISIKGQGNTFEQTAEFLNITKSAVQCYLKRAEEKVEKYLDNGIQTSLF